MSVRSTTQPTPQWHAPYRSIKPLGVLVYALFAAQIGLAAMTALAAQAWHDDLADLSWRWNPPAKLLEASAEVAASFQRFQALRDITSLVALAAFLTWAYRAQRNLPALGVSRPRFTPGWAIAWYFVPILSLIRPFQVMSETFAGSEPAGLNTIDGKAQGRS